MVGIMNKSDLVFGEEKKILYTTLSTMILGYSIKINAYAKIGSINAVEELKELKEMLDNYFDEFLAKYEKEGEYEK